jgi:hypothetical protein
MYSKIDLKAIANKIDATVADSITEEDHDSVLLMTEVQGELDVLKRFTTAVEGEIKRKNDQEIHKSVINSSSVLLQWNPQE